MSSQYKCFVKYEDNKFDVIVKDDNHKIMLWRKWSDLMPRVAQIFRLALNKELNSDSHVFEVFSTAHNKWFVITADDLLITQLSVVQIYDKPLPLSLGKALVNDPDIQYLLKNTNDIIAFYVLIQSIDKYCKCFDLVNDSKKSAKWKWKTIADTLVSIYPNIFRSKTKTSRPAYCSDIFTRLTKFYIKAYSTLNLKLEPRLQRRFDMLKIVHIHNPNRFFKKNLFNEIQKLAEEPDIKTYIEYQRKYGFDMYLNILVIDLKITHKEFADKYLDKCANN